jgi:hypothetical protein
MATIGFTLEVLGGFDGLDPEAPFFYVGRGHVLRDGYLSEERQLYGHDGRLLARNHQTFVVIK